MDSQPDGGMDDEQKLYTYTMPIIRCPHSTNQWYILPIHNSVAANLLICKTNLKILPVQWLHVLALCELHQKEVVFILM